MNIFNRLESNVRTYSRSFPALFTSAKGAVITDNMNRKYIDFFSGAGALSYGHNHDAMKQALIDYIASDGITHSLDMATDAKRWFIEKFEQVILAPRQMYYKMQFPGPTGTNAVEAALKIAKKVSGSSKVVAFTNAYHGLTAGALEVTANPHYRHHTFFNKENATFIPFDGVKGEDIDTIEILRNHLKKAKASDTMPAAVILETIQAEGGVNVASNAWLQRLSAACKEFNVFLIVDDIQVGCGRTGDFFSFEEAGIEPDIIVLSKSISGYGLPMSLVLLKPELDQWAPGEHTGTFRGNNLAFVTALEALKFWDKEDFSIMIKEKGQFIYDELSKLCRNHDYLDMKIRGRGMIFGLEIPDAEIASQVAKNAFDRGLIIELCGVENNVLKFIPPFVIEDKQIKKGFEILDHELNTVAPAVAG